MAIGVRRDLMGAYAVEGLYQKFCNSECHRRLSRSGNKKETVASGRGPHGREIESSASTCHGGPSLLSAPGRPCPESCAKPRLCGQSQARSDLFAGHGAGIVTVAKQSMCFLIRETEISRAFAQRIV